MSHSFTITNASIVNEGRIFTGSVAVKDGVIVSVTEGTSDLQPEGECMDAGGLLLIPGVIDCHVHFREPGVTHKADLSAESRAAVAGGVTSFMEMPNTVPQTLTLELLEEKYRLAAEKSLANHAFFLGASNDNIGEIVKADPRRVCGVKVFFGASTGNMLVDKPETLEEIFRLSPVPVAAHCENEAMIREAGRLMREKYGEDVPVEMHPAIRSAEACYSSSELAVKLAKQYGTRLHITHLSTAAELALLGNELPVSGKKITAEVCTHYLWFSSDDYATLGKKIKVNPAIKTPGDRKALLEALLDGRIDMIATDHAPHLLSEKEQTYFLAPSGTPLVQFSLPAVMELSRQGKISLETLVERMCHAPAACYAIEKRGFIRPGYFADLVLVDPEAPWKVTQEDILSKCGWSAFEGQQFHARVMKTFVNGNLVYDNGQVNDNSRGMRLTFDR